MSLALTAARAALLRKQASARRLALGLGALGTAGVGTAAGLGAFSKAPAAPEGGLAEALKAGTQPQPQPQLPARRVSLREQLQKGVVGKVTQGLGNVLSRMHGRYAGGQQ